MSRRQTPWTRAAAAEILDVLERVSPDWPAAADRDLYRYGQTFGNVEFTLPNGWRVVVFKDGYGFDAWDYIDSIDTGTTYYEYPFGRCKRVVNWSPSKPGWGPHRPSGPIGMPAFADAMRAIGGLLRGLTPRS